MNESSASKPKLPSPLIDLWHLMAGRIAPQICCQNPPPMYRLFQAAIREVAREKGDLDLAVEYLKEIVSDAQPEWMIFEQAGQLLNIIEWRKKYHPNWFSPNTPGKRMRSGLCAQYIAKAMAFLEAGSDSNALEITEKIIERGVSGSDDIVMAHLMRATIFICSGDIDTGEAEYRESVQMGVSD